MNTEQDLNLVADHVAAADAAPDNPTVRRGLLAVLGGIVAAATFRPSGAKAAAVGTVSGASTSEVGFLASTGDTTAPFMPVIGSTTHSIIGSQSTATKTLFGSGVAGVRNGSNLAGVLGANGSSGFGVFGRSESGIGILGQSSTGAAIRGESGSYYGGVFVTNRAGVAAVYGGNRASTNKVAALFQGDVRVEGNFAVTGAKAAAVMLDGELATVYCQESPEPFFEDFGRAQLQKGSAFVPLEPKFASLVKLEDYMVFLSREGDSESIFVSRRDPAGFEVREAKGGSSDVPFSYRIVARRKDIAGDRLARLDSIEPPNLENDFSVASAKPHPARSGRSDDEVLSG